MKHARVQGTFGLQDAAVQIWFYQDTSTQDLYGYIELGRRSLAGFDIDIEVGTEYDTYTWEAQGSTPPTVANPRLTPWWKPLEAPNQSGTGAGTAVWMDKVGIGEKQPQYALDVRSDARFQSKVYQPFPADLREAMGLSAANAQGDLALTDVLEWLVRRVLR
jgi:hypothetical protein